MKYRPEIDGLRAIAVLPVIFFHAGFSLFSGGFVGVDIFFVISGYLITSIILTEKTAGKFSLLRFYERRARRIMPALFLVMFICLPFAWMWMLPSDLKDFSRSLAAVSVFSSNILFFTESGYFNPAVDLKPLLHTWSLGVEEQYYVLFPLLILASWRMGKRFIISLLIIIAIVSLLVAQWGATHKPEAAFYLLPTRAWELLLGALAAFHLFYKDNNEYTGNIYSSLINQLMSALGLVLIIYANYIIDRNTPFPGFYALIPTVGTLLIILYTTPQTFVGKLLAMRVFVGIGLISYSAYLWHQPILAFIKHYGVDDPSIGLIIGLLVLTFIMAYLSWRYVEQPFRNRQRITRTAIFTLTLLMSSLFIAIGLYGNYKEGFINRFSTQEQALINARNYDYQDIYRNQACLLSSTQSYEDFAPQCSAIDMEEPVFMMLGDSFAAAAWSGLRLSLPNMIQYTGYGCAPIGYCRELQNFAINEIEHIKPNYILLHADWIDKDLNKDGIYLATQISKTIDEIQKKSPLSTIFVIGSVPHWGSSGLPQIMLKTNMYLDKEQYIKSLEVARLTKIDEQLRSVAIAKKHVYFLSIRDKFCKGDECLAVLKDNNQFKLTSFDRGHLTEAGSIKLASTLVPEIISIISKLGPVPEDRKFKNGALSVGNIVVDNLIEISAFKTNPKIINAYANDENVRATVYTCKRIDKHYSFRGWAVHKGRNNKDLAAYNVVIKKADKFYKADTYSVITGGWLTPYLNSEFGDKLEYDQIGFRARISEDQIGKEPVEIYLHLNSDNQDYLIETDCEFNQVEIAPFHAPELSSPPKDLVFYLDSCGKQEDNYIFDGWATYKGFNNQIQSPITQVLIKKGAQMYKLRTKMIGRKEVTAHLNKVFNDTVNYDQSGFKASIQSESIGNDPVQMYLHMNSEGKNYLIETDCKLNQHKVTDNSAMLDSKLVMDTKLEMQYFEMPKLSSPPKDLVFYLDSCGKQEDNYIFDGWVAYKEFNNQIQSPITQVLIKKGPQMYKLRTKMIGRKEVTAHLNKVFNDTVNYDQSGFKASIQSESIGNDPIQMYLHMNSEGQDYLIETDCRLN